MEQMESIKMFMGRFMVTRAELPQFATMYQHIENQGNVFTEQAATS